MRAFQNVVHKNMSGSLIFLEVDLMTMIIVLCVSLQCSVSCGGGQKQREVNCLSEQDMAVMPNSLCEKISKPETLRKCNMQECKTNTGLYATISLSGSLAGSLWAHLFVTNLTLNHLK